MTHRYPLFRVVFYGFPIPGAHVGIGVHPTIPVVDSIPGDGGYLCSITNENGDQRLEVSSDLRETRIPDWQKAATYGCFQI